MAPTSSWIIAIFPFALYAVFALVRYFYFHDAPPPGLKLIPGPTSTIPYIGRVHDVDPTCPEISMRRFCDQYNGIFRLTICGEMHIWIGDQDIAFELLCRRAKKYSSRPMVPAIPGSDSQGLYLPLLAADDHWRRQRHFANTSLMASLQQQYQGYIDLEIRLFLRRLLTSPKDHFTHLHDFCGRISARLGYGRPEPSAALSENAITFIGQISPSGPITNLLPFLGHLPEWLNPSIRRVRERREKEAELFKHLMAQARSDMSNGTLPMSYARNYIEQKGASNAHPFDFEDEEEAIYAVGMLVTVAIFTIGGPLYCFFLAMVLHPEWQTRVREEYDAVIGDRPVAMKDSPNLPVLRAAIKECFRWRPPVALGVPRLVEEDDEWNGYYIPKGAVVHAVDLAMARDANIYPDPDSYRPERWLQSDFPTYREPLTEYPRFKGYHGFGMGRRVCMGIELTEAELLVACGSIVGSFELKPTTNAKGEPQWPHDYKFTPNLIGGPLPFELDIEVRSPERAKLIEAWYQESR
ncbi:cytochrome P450 oxidoreductase [Pseudovirgaria hyperparasitica]|uniref:Cytochrome P450 oxidoreductase n=1 Tax=Pseudovirgaria hyperparasitica TaxID=470096 RepID=A0A6A6VW23_9PEZI|nr:cytochrome P450 oxidoreductase [Pseudovirgaria hyperparasitica]KAF2753441.1 cytochrome P450 oxidoreductase [Pseudovirgaria hyperparasitica]